MAHLADSNILLRIEEPEHEMHKATVDTLKRLRENGEHLYILRQNLYEFWNVSTRPKDKNGLGKTVEEADYSIEKLLSLFTLLPEKELIFWEWKRLCVFYSVKGVQVHDARIASAMLVHGITHILTFNADDFKRFEGITAVRPSEVK